MKIFKHAWPYCFAIAIIVFFIAKQAYEHPTSPWGDFAALVIGFVIIAPLVGVGFFSLIMWLINQNKKAQG